MTGPNSGPPSAANPPTLDEAYAWLRRCTLPEADAHDSAALRVVLTAIENQGAGAAPDSGQADTVNHPPHYRSHPSGVECIQITEHMSFNVGNAIKYLWRADLKGAPVEDLRKAAWYVEREIARRDAGSSRKAGDG